MKSLLTILLVSVSLSSVQVWAGQPQIVGQAKSDLQSFSGKSGKLEVLEDGVANQLIGTWPCSINYENWFPENDGFSVYAISLLKSTSVKFMLSSTAKKVFGSGTATRSASASSIQYKNNFDKSSTGDLGSMYCGEVMTHLSVSPTGVTNVLNVTGNSVQILIDYSCPFYSPNGLSGKHKISWTCQF